MADELTDSVTVINEQYNTINTTITGVVSYPSGVATDNDNDYVYVSGGGPDGNQTGTSMLNDTMIAATIPAGSGPLAVDESTHTVYLIDTPANDMTVVSEAAHVVDTAVPAGNVPEGIAVDHDTATAYVADWGSSQGSAPGSVLVIPLNAQGVPTPIGTVGLIGLAAAVAVGLAIIQRRSRRTRKTQAGTLVLNVARTDCLELR